MIEHQPLPVAGYTAQPDSKVNTVNEHKAIEESLLQRLDWMQHDAKTADVFDARWLAIARTHFEQGFMALNRAVFRPQRLGGPTLPPETIPTSPQS